MPLSCRRCCGHPIYTRYLCAYRILEIIQCHIVQREAGCESFKKALAEDGLVLTKLDGVIPASDLDGMSRTIFNTDILADTSQER